MDRDHKHAIRKRIATLVVALGASGAFAASAQAATRGKVEQSV